MNQKINFLLAGITSGLALVWATQSFIDGDTKKGLLWVSFAALNVSWTAAVALIRERDKTITELKEENARLRGNEVAA